MSFRQAVLRTRALRRIDLPQLRSYGSETRKPIPKIRRWANLAVKGCGITVIGLGTAVVGFFAYDAMTYHESEARGVQVSALALHPERGGPKNLPIASQAIDENDDEAARRNKEKPRLVILGSGWGAVSLIQRLNPDNYNVTVISPSNYFLFTPLLPSATVGTVELRSIVEPIRKIANRVHAHYLEASAQSVDFSNKLIEVSETAADGTKQSFYVPYDKLVISVGAAQNTHGVDGLEHVHYLKTVQDCQKIRRQVMDNFELAALPVTSEEERKKLLSFVVCGGGPTGVEFAAELYDMINEDLSQYFPRILRNETSVHVIQSRSHILNTYDATISEYAERKFAHDDVDVQINARVQKVLKDKVIFTQKLDGKEVTKEVPFGLCLWSTGVALAPITQQICEQIEAQKNKHAIETDSHLRVVGLPLGDVYAVGDCATVQNNVADHVLDFIRGDVREQIDKNGNCEISMKDFRQVAKEIKRSFPQASDHLAKLDEAFQKFDVDKNGKLSLEELKDFLVTVDRKLTSLPATAQRAHQQGTYLAKKFNILARTAPTYEMNEIRDGDIDSTVYKAFQYHHLGSLAYLGNSAVGDLPGGYSLTGGLIAMYMWRSVYWSEQVSLRTRVLLAIDWAKRAIWGRDLSRF